MTSERSRYGLFVSALGAVVLVVSVFLPWYAASFAAQGAPIARHTGEITGQQALSGLAMVLLVLAGLALLDALFPIARAASGVPDGAGGAVVLLGLVASACVLYRMVDPAQVGDALSLSLREGAWTALLGSLMIVLGGLWPRPCPGSSRARRSAPTSGRPCPGGHPAPEPGRGGASRAEAGASRTEGGAGYAERIASGSPGSSASRARRCSMMRAVAPQMRWSSTT